MADPGVEESEKRIFVKHPVCWVCYEVNWQFRLSATPHSTGNRNHIYGNILKRENIQITGVFLNHSIERVELKNPLINCLCLKRAMFMIFSRILFSV